MTKLCPRGKAAAKRKFKVYPSAYANAYASKICAGKIKDPSGVKRKDFRGSKAEGGLMEATTRLKRQGLKSGSGPIRVDHPKDHPDVKKMEKSVKKDVNNNARQEYKNGQLNQHRLSASSLASNNNNVARGGRIDSNNETMDNTVLKDQKHQNCTTNSRNKAAFSKVRHLVPHPPILDTRKSSNAGVVQEAKNLGIESIILSHKGYKLRKEYEEVDLFLNSIEKSTRGISR